MKTIANVVFSAVLAFCQAAHAQQPATHVFETIAQPGSSIGGRTFTPQTLIGSAVLSESGEVAFIATAPGQGAPAVFTSRRIVATQGDLVDGKYLIMIPSNGILVINNAGQVAFEAWYADSKELAAAGDATGRGIFVENRLASDAVFDARGNAAAFVLTEDGRIAVANPHPAPAKPAEPGLRIRIKPPKDFPVSVTGANRPAAVNRKQVAGERLAPPMFPTNHRGQILIPVDFRGGGFLLLLGMPVQH